MSKTTKLSALALAVLLGCSEAQAQTPIPPSPQDFVTAAAQSDQYEIMAAHVAEIQAQDPRVRAFAQEMIQDHTRLNQDLRQAALASKLQAPESGMSSDQAALLSGLQSLRGPNFDRTYARQQVLAHTQAVVVEGSFAEAGAYQPLRKAAQSALPKIQDHLKKAQQLGAELAGD